MSTSNTANQPAKRKGILGLHPNVIFLGLASFLTDISSEMTLTILPLFLANVLGVGTAIIGLIEGVADSTATVVKVVSGWLSDRIGKRKSLTALGYGLSAISKPILYFATAWSTVLAVRFTDRVGKGIRSAPRDALLADSADAKVRGKAFGFHRAMDTGGAVVGLALAAGLVYLAQKNALELSRGAYQKLVLVGIIPGILAVLLILFFVKELKKAASPVQAVGSSPASSKARFDTRFKIYLGVMLLFTLGNSSDAFLLLRAQNLGVSTFHIFLLLVMFNLVYTLISLPAGILSDRLGRKGIIALGWTIYGLVYLGFALATSTWQVLSLFVVYGLYYGMTEGVARAFVADMVPAERRGTAYGLFNGAVGITALPASLIAGFLWQTVSPSAPFFFGAALALAAMVGLLVLVKPR